jgi:hypothetical protein
VPFTPAHVIAVVPAMRWHRALRLDPTCLVIGSMAPDFEYFTRGEMAGQFGHSFVGILAWGVPVTLVLAALHHALVKWPVLLAAPARLTPLLGGPPPALSVPALASMVVSAALGDLTHVLWDGATHATGVFVTRIPALSVPYTVPVLGEMPLHRIVQHASTVVGLVVLTWVFARALRRAGPVREIGLSRARARIAFTACIATGVALTLYRSHRMHIVDPGSLIVAGISGLLAGTIVASVLARADGRRYRDLVSG